jgi:hypothetical protein
MNIINNYFEKIIIKIKKKRFNFPLIYESNFLYNLFEPYKYILLQNQTIASFEGLLFVDSLCEFFFKKNYIFI